MGQKVGEGRALVIKGWTIRISFRRVFWFQTQVPVKVRHFLCFWILKEARPCDVDKKQEFPTGFPGTLMNYEGKTYRYYKAGEDIVEHSAVTTKE